MQRDTSPLDPGARLVVELMEKAGRRDFYKMSAEEAREVAAKGRHVVQPDPPVMAAVRTLLIPGPAGDITARQYFPRPPREGRVAPVLVYFHGGGWVIGDLDSHDVLCRQIADRSGVMVISVDYRLAPEHRFPAAVDDAFAATAWIAKNARGLGVDASRIAVGGDSAGGNLATVAALMARDQGGPGIAFQLLIYPSVDMSMTQMSHQEHGDVLPLTTPVMHWFRDHYLGETPDRHVADWRASPLSANLRGLPPAWVVTAGYDVLVDEGLDYVDRLRSAGVACEHTHYPGQIHGFITMGRLIPEANAAVEEAAVALRAAIGGSS